MLVLRRLSSATRSLCLSFFPRLSPKVGQMPRQWRNLNSRLFTGHHRFFLRDRLLARVGVVLLPARDAGYRRRFVPGGAEELRRVHVFVFGAAPEFPAAPYFRLLILCHIMLLTMFHYFTLSRPKVTGRAWSPHRRGDEENRCSWSLLLQQVLQGFSRNVK